MSKVIHGIDINKIALCWRCKTVFEYEDSEVRYWTNYDGPGGCGGQEKHVDCPGCGRSVDVN